MIRTELINECPSVRELIGDLKAGKIRIKTDSRLVECTDAFVCIRGERFDAMDFVDDVIKKNVKIIVCEDTKKNRDKIKTLLPCDVCWVLVQDSICFIQELARLHVAVWRQAGSDRHVFAICGSNGKTTHKEILNFVLSQLAPGEFVITKDNNNNHLGVPFTLLEIDEHKHRWVFIELGSNHPGEIKALCEIADPDSGIVTNIGHTHLEFFGTLEKVYEEEGYLFHHIEQKKKNGGELFIINGDDEYLNRFQNNSWSLRVGTMDHNQIHYLIKRDFIEIQGLGLQKAYTLRNQSFHGEHNLINIANCFLVLRHFFPDREDKIKNAIEHFKPQNMRSQWIEFHGKKVFLDAYNANPSSMKAALKTFKQFLDMKAVNLQQALIVMGDMKELGQQAGKFHSELGEYVKELGFSEVYFVGGHAKDYACGFGLDSHCFSSAAQALDAFQKNKCQYVFLKGSRSLQLEQLIAIT